MMTLLCAVVSTAWAGENEVYNFAFTQQSGPSGYANTYTVTIGGKSWTIPGNLTNGNYLRIGGKSISEVDRVVQCNDKLTGNISKIVFNHNGKSRANVTVHSVKVTVANDAAFTKIVDEVTVSNPTVEKNTEGSIDFTPNPNKVWSGDLYYKFTVNISNPDTSNGGLDLTSLVFYESVSGAVDPVVNFANESEEIEVGETVTNTLTKPNDLTVTYSSDPTSVATVDEDGVVTGVAEGEAEITASWEAVANKYNAGSVSYTLTVTAATPTVNYVKVTNANQLLAGNEYILVGNRAGKTAAMGARTGTNTYRNEVLVTVTDDKVAVKNNDGIAILTLGGESGAWTFKASDNNEYLALTANSNALHSSADVTDNTKWTITDDFQVKDNNYNRFIQYNSGATRFACYTSGQGESYLYVKEGSDISDLADPELSFDQASFDVLPNESDFIGQDVNNPHDLDVNFSSSDENLAIVDPDTGEVIIGETEGTVTITASFSGNGEYAAGTATYTIKISKGNAELSFSTTSFEVEPDDDFTAPTLTNPHNLTVTYSSSDENLAMVDEATGEVLIGSNEGFVTITASTVGNVQYNAGSASYTIKIGDPNMPGTLDDPYTVAEARAAIDANTGITSVYATGIVSKIVTAYNSQYGNITYDISADGTTSGDQLRAYRGKSYNGDNFTSADDIKVGDVVVVFGNLKKYNTIYEFDENNELVSLVRKSDPGFVITNAPETMEVDDVLELDWESSSNGAITYVSSNPDVADVEDGYLMAYDFGEATITATQAATDEYNEATYTFTVTVGTVPPVIDYATLPFEFDGGKADIEDTSGLTQEGLDSDYGSSPKLKFNGTGDYVILKFNERPGKLTFDLKGNSFSGGTFTVQTSEDGENYTTIKTYTSISGATNGQSETINNLGENVRYIKWVYTTKVDGNVGMGNIKLAKYEVPQPYTVTITPNDNAEIFVFYNDPYNNWPDIQSGDEVLSGSEVMVSTSASEGYQIESVTVTDENEQEIELTEAEEGISWTFIMPSSDVTISCTVTKEPTGKKYVKVTSTEDITSGKYLIVYEEGSVAFDGSLETLDAESNIQEVVMNNNVIKTDEPIYFTIDVNKGSIRSASGKYIGVTSYSNGLSSSGTNGYGKQSFTIDDNGNAVIVCKTTGGNMTLRFNKAIDQRRFRYFKTGQQSIQLYKAEDEPFTFTISDRATDGETCYATIADLGAGYFKVEGNVEVSTVVINEDKQLSYPITFKENDVISGQGAYLVKGAAGEYTFPTAEEGDVPDLGENMLISSGMGDVSADDMLAIAKAATNHEGDFKFYKLSLNGKGEAGSVGFYWGAAKGAAFNYTKAHQAFLAVPQTGESIESGDGVAAFLFDGDKTGIYNVMATESESNNDTYTLSGIRVENKQLPKGIYIKNGKKVVVK